MFFKNLQMYRVPAPWAMTADKLAECLAPQTFTPCTSLDLSSSGWIAPRTDGLVHTVGGQMLICLQTEKKLLPASVINRLAQERAAEIEEQQGFKPGRKQMKELKEQVTDELLPRALHVRSSVNVWIDPIHGWLCIDSSSPSRADEILKLLLRAIDEFPMHGLRVKQSPLASMTTWLATDEAPSGFTIDQDTELRSSGDSHATVRYAKQAPEADNLRRHIAAGKQCTRLALTWNDRISFVLTESLALKRIAPLGVIKENADAMASGDDERFDGDMLMMAGELNQMMGALVQAMGGEQIDVRAAA